jgi:hypothetical protein
VVALAPAAVASRFFVGEATALGVSPYSGIQTPKSQKPHWLKPGSQSGFTVYPQ